MIKTYYIENANNQILGYYKTLNESKYSIKKLSSDYNLNDLKIVALRGQYFGEGFHFYYYYFNNNKFKRVKN